MTAAARDFKKEEAFTAAQLAIFELRCGTLADRVRAGNLGFVDAVDLAASAAEWSGLAESAGWDKIQFVMAAAFGTCPRRPE